MPTIKELVAEVEAEPNAIKAVDMGLEAVEAFARQALKENDGGNPTLENLISLVVALRIAVPANVIPASAGPVGKSPHEQYLEQAHDAVNESLGKLSETLAPVSDILARISAAVEHATQAVATIKGVPK